MIQEILNIANDVSFDFRQFAAPDDPLAHLFPEWVDYYRLKYAVCKVIRPRTVLEVGVRYGYSAITFLNACPDAHYLGIDNDSSSFGGIPGALEWARKITNGYHAEFLIEDTQTMTSFPGDFYDLVHIDGQQDGDGTFHDLEMGLEKGRFILIDGFFWSRENMLSSTYFLEKYRKFIEYSIVIPGYAGELLIKTKLAARNAFPERSGASMYSTLQRCYDEDYYLNDCGGHSSFKRTRGLELEDMRLLAMYYLANPSRGQRVLDVGCGRGELTLAMSMAGATAVGVDYAEDSINIAQRALNEAKENGVKSDVTYVREDVLNLTTDAKFDAVVAADFVEHIEQELLGKIFQKISGLLTRDGIFIVHTSPNKLNYLYEYSEKRRRAKKIGLYLPPSPRTYYEDLMHINEQSPAQLSRTLRKYFPCVHAWVTTLPNVTGSLSRPFSRAELCEATSIFAVASGKAIERKELISRITQNALNGDDLKVALSLSEDEITVKRSELFGMTVSVQNRGKERFVSLPPFPVHIAYHWMNKEGQWEVFDGIRTPIRVPIPPSGEREFNVTVMAPEKAGEYVLEMTMVQEDRFWFEQMVPEIAKKVTVTVL